MKTHAEIVWDGTAAASYQSDCGRFRIGREVAGGLPGESWRLIDYRRNKRHFVASFAAAKALAQSIVNGEGR